MEDSLWPTFTFSVVVHAYNPSIEKAKAAYATH